MKRTAFSLAEVLIATGILGVGLIMVASIFPVAIVQHREAADIAAASTLAQRARAMLLARVNIDDRGLYRPIRLGVWPGNTVPTPPYQPTPWMAIPIQSLIPAGLLGGPDGMYEPLPLNQADLQVTYENVLSNPPIPTPPPNLGDPVLPDTITMFSARDLVSDLRPPQNDTQAEEVPSRLVWYPFYREISASDVEFCVAVCRQTRGAVFGMQDTTLANPAQTPSIRAGYERRFPIPWRVTVARWGPQRLTNELPGFGGADLGRMCPVGTKLLVTGLSSNWQYPVPSGRVLTVTDVIAENTANPDRVRWIDVAEDISDFPVTVPSTTFDIWVFPPQLGNTVPRQLEFAKSPVLEWFHF